MAPSWVVNAACPVTESRTGPKSQAVNAKVPVTRATLFENGPLCSCRLSASDSGPKAGITGPTLSGKGKGPGRIWITGPPPRTWITPTSASAASFPTCSFVFMPSFSCDPSPTGQ